MRIAVKTLLPLNVGLIRGTGNYLHALDYISGTSFRGAAASAYLLQGGRAEDQAFKEVFIQERVFFSNLYPSKPLPHPNESFGWRAPKIIPLTARSCKRFKGFAYRSKDEGGEIEQKHGVGDMLLLLALAGINKEPGFLEDIKYCTRCNSHSNQVAMDRFPGFYQRQDYSKAYDSAKAGTRAITRTAIDRRTGRAMDKMLYSLEVINEEEYFIGQVRLSDGLTSAGHEMVQRLLAPGQVLRIGRSKTRGLGKVQILDDYTSNKKTLPLETRYFEFNRCLKDYARKKNTALDAASGFFSLTLQSDLILIDPFLRYLKELNVEDLAREGIVERGQVEKVCQIIEGKVIRGWNSAALLPKEDEWAIAKGSVFLFKCKNLNKNSLPSFFGELEQLESSGLGLRQGEGFGHISICDPFHWEVNQ